MSDYLSRLVERPGSAPASVRPALPSLFEPVKAGGACAARSLSRGTEPISGTEHDVRPTSEAGVESRSIHDRVASIQSIWTAAITSAAPPKTALATLHPPLGPKAALEPPGQSPHQPPAVEPRPAEPTAPTRPVRVFAAETRAIADPPTEAQLKAPPTSRMVRGLATAPLTAPRLMPAIAAVPVAPIASGARAREQTAFVTNAAASPAPTIHISIGRVEVRAIMPTVQAGPPSERSAPKLSLDDYLRSRNGGSA